jgi:ABC-type Fe3+-hydroxamate transport system substrate-binding protein
LKFFVLIALLIISAPFPVRGESFDDALGRKVELSQPPERIISLVPAVTEILFKLDLQDKLVAVTDYCDYPEAAKKLPKVGKYSRPSLESILLYKPDLVMASASMNRRSLVKRLESLNIPVYIIFPHNIEDTLKTIITIGTINGRQDKAETVVAAIQTKIDGIEKHLEQTKKPDILTFIMLRPLTVAGPETFIDDIIIRTGGNNIVPPGPSRYPTWNTEALLTLDPEVIVVSSHPGQPDPQQFFQQWPQLQAVKNNRIVQIEADWLHRPGPRMVLGIEAMAKALHPDINFDD